MLALAWWSFLLFKKNGQTHQLELQLYPDKKEMIDAKFERQQTMIIGESSVFALALVMGIWLIGKAYTREVDTGKKQNNFLLSVTHELKSPLSSIKLILQTFLKRNLTPEQNKTMSTNALSEVTRLEGMVNNLLLTTRIDHQYQYNFEEADITALLNSRAELIKIKYPNREVILNISDEIIANIDQEAFVSLIDNLIENAIKYSSNSSPISIMAKKSNKHFEIDVIDQGIGIPADERNKVIQKFYRIGNEETRKSQGSGLGLYIVNQIVLKHRGKITIEDNLPQGTLLNIQIPFGLK